MKPSSVLSALAAGVTIAAGAVTLAPPASATTVTLNARDAFARSVFTGLGNADVGGSWVTNSPTRFRVSHGAAIYPPGSGQTAAARLSGVNRADEFARLTFVFPTLPAVGQILTVRTRMQPDGRSIAGQIRLSATGAMRISVMSVTATTNTALSSAPIVAYTIVPGARYNLELVTVGTTEQARIYPTTATSAPAWQVAASAPAPPVPGSVGFSGSTLTGTTGVTVHVLGMYGLAVQSAPTFVPSSAQPGPTNTGVPAGTHLTIHNGDMNITTPGTVISGLDIHGNVNIAAPNVVLKNSIVRGGAFPAHGHCIVEDNKAGNGLNFLIEDTELAPTNVNYYQNDICGANFTALRINSHSGVDTMDIAGNNVTLKDSWLHDTTHFAYSPEHNNGTHNDGLQITVGSNINITHNVIRGGGNSAIQITQDQGVTTGLTIANNWFDGGTCSLHIDDKPLSSMSHIAVSGSIFTPNSTIAHCDAVVTHAVTMTWSANTWSAGGVANPIIYG